MATFDCSLTALCSKLFAEERTEVTMCGSRGTTFCFLLDLLEVLTASGLMCGTGARLSSQRIPGIHSAALLMNISCCSKYYVKKQILLLLKKVLLQKVGEDCSLEGLVSTSWEHKDINADRFVLAQSVLKAVADNWLHSVQVEHAVFFGGSRQSQENKGLKPDGTVLRAVSLVLLKSLEIQLQTAATTGKSSIPLSFCFVRTAVLLLVLLSTSIFPG